MDKVGYALAVAMSVAVVHYFASKLARRSLRARLNVIVIAAGTAGLIFVMSL